jgi:hypothetical protein
MVKDKYAESSEIWCGLNRPDLSETEADVVVFIFYHKSSSLFHLIRSNILYQYNIIPFGLQICEDEKSLFFKMQYIFDIMYFI